jgi:hypothetical protein
MPAGEFLPFLKTQTSFDMYVRMLIDGTQEKMRQEVKRRITLIFLLMLSVCLHFSFLLVGAKRILSPTAFIS